MYLVTVGAFSCVDNMVQYETGTGPKKVQLHSPVCVCVCVQPVSLSAPLAL